MALGISGSNSVSSSKSSQEQKADARTSAKTKNKGGSNKLTITGLDPATGTALSGGVPSWLWILAAVIIFLVVIALILGG